MSLDFSLIKTEDVYSGNYTHNVTDMWMEAASFNSLFKLSHLNEGTWHRVCAVYIDNLTYLVEPWNFEVIP